jgi:hypothetical protein
MTRPRLRKVGLVALAVFVCLGVVVTRAFLDGRAALSRGDRAAAAGDIDEAIAEWRRAARWYVPGAPHVDGAYERLEAAGQAADQAGDLTRALAAWSAVRSSVLSTRSFYTPFPTRLAQANERIAALMARQEKAADPGKDEEARRAWHAGLLARDDAPSVGWSIIALLGFALWVGGGFLFSWRGVSATGDRLDRKTAARAGVMIALGLVVWMLGLYRA